ncbi:hypothetical protein HN51_000056 [Arachis hypogaea]
MAAAAQVSPVSSCTGITGQRHSWTDKHLASKLPSAVTAKCECGPAEHCGGRKCYYGGMVGTLGRVFSQEKKNLTPPAQFMLLFSSSSPLSLIPAPLSSVFLSRRLLPSTDALLSPVATSRRAVLTVASLCRSAVWTSKTTSG